ncbi:hypothetical protein GE107_14490 [Cohnella sp. CFH 77786]|uniref:hypothetical protein n=1 Tax=Cohnella sp. CFH 77786 TaxID=2662265 RepID=UPI001C6081DF|nr:hypothetical protein [Cohnella sp. CFH 77786]MBW5447261.1 hypothetical protein [Cohnella sp. CFH 77786]
MAHARAGFCRGRIPGYGTGDKGMTTPAGFFNSPFAALMILILFVLLVIVLKFC